MKFNPSQKYRIECRAILKRDLEARGSEIEKIKKQFEEKYGNRKDVKTYYMINEVKDK